MVLSSFLKSFLFAVQIMTPHRAKPLIPNIQRKTLNHPVEKVEEEEEEEDEEDEEEEDEEVVV